MPADTRLYLHFEGKIKDSQFEEYKKFINDIRESASKAGSDFWCPASDGERIIHNEAFANEANFKRHMNEWVPTIGERLGQIVCPAWLSLIPEVRSSLDLWGLKTSNYDL